MSHKTGFLSGTEPEEKEKKTEAQINDERRPDSMRVSQEISRHYNETDERPAIEQVFEHNEVKASKHTGKNFSIDRNVAQEIHARKKAEHEARMKAREKAAAEQKEEQAKRDQEIAEKIKETQSLDPNEIKAKHRAEQEKANLEKLYPDPIKEQSDVEEALWQKRKDKGAQIASRAKLEDVYDDKLHNGIIKSFIFQLLGLGIYATIITTDTTFSVYIKFLFYAGCAIAFIFSYRLLRQCSEKYINKEIPSDQESLFKLATLLPFMALRISIASIIAQTPIIGGALGTLICVAIGSSLHYSFLYKYHIAASRELVALNVLVYIFTMIVPSIIAFLTSLSSGPTEMLILLIWVAETLIFFIGDRFAAKMAPGTTINKT